MLELKKKVGSILPGGTQGIQIHYEEELFIYADDCERKSGFSVSELANKLIHIPTYNPIKGNRDHINNIAA